MLPIEVSKMPPCVHRLSVTQYHYIINCIFDRHYLLFPMRTQISMHVCDLDSVPYQALSPHSARNEVMGLPPVPQA